MSRRVATLLFWLAAACAQSRAADEAPSRALREGVLATVNDAAITEADLALRSRPTGHEAAAEPADLGPARRKNALDAIVREELVAQRAVELGLASDPALREELDRRQAAVDAFRRQRLGDLYQRHERDAVRVTDAEARRTFDAHAQELRTEVHVRQILVRDEARIEQARRDIAAGTPFEDVARRLLSPAGLPEGTRPPWDLGWLRGGQVPEPWREVLSTLPPGGTSGILRGPRNRFWIIQLVERRVDPDIGFDVWRANIIETLRAEKLEARRAADERALRGRARIVYADRSTRATRVP